MKYPKVIIFLAAAFTAVMLNVSCNKKKTAINDSENSIKEAIDDRKQELNRDAELAISKVDANAKIDKAIIKAGNESIQAQLDADKKIAEADADEKKAALDTNE